MQQLCPVFDSVTQTKPSALAVQRKAWGMIEVRRCFKKEMAGRGNGWGKGGAGRESGEMMGKPLMHMGDGLEGAGLEELCGRNPMEDDPPHFRCLLKPAPPPSSTSPSSSSTA